MTIDFRLPRRDAEAKASSTITELVAQVEAAVEIGCKMVVLSEDCLCTSGWEAGNADQASAFLRNIVSQLLGRLGETARTHRVSVVCCNDRVDDQNQIRNTAYLINEFGDIHGVYDNVCFPVHETWKVAGNAFPVFETSAFGKVGLLICYDMVFPEPSRCLALNGADIILNPTVGGAAFGGADISQAAFRTRAAENFTTIATSWGGWGTDVGSMIFSPKGQILAEAYVPGEVAVTEFAPDSGRDHADWSNAQTDTRARLFRERQPQAFSVLTELNPPATRSLPPIEPDTPDRIADTIKLATTVGHLEFEAAETLLQEGKLLDAKHAYNRLIAAYPSTWFDRTARVRLQEIEATQ